jgi:hypothetical protein
MKRPTPPDDAKAPSKSTGSSETKGAPSKGASYKDKMQAAVALRKTKPKTKR